MGSRRTLILVGAMVVGVIAALLIFNYVGGIEEQAKGDAQLVPVVVAGGSIAKGADASALIASNAITTGERREADLPQDRVLRPAEIKGQVAQINIEPGTVITKSMFSTNVDQVNNSVAGNLKDGMVAVTTSADTVKSVAGLIRQGDYVNLTLVTDCVDQGGKLVPKNSAAIAAAGATTPAADVQSDKCALSVYQKIRILALGQSLGTSVAAAPQPGAAPATTAAPSTDSITFEVPQEAAQVIQLAGPGSLYMTLVRRDYVPVKIPAIRYLPTPGVDGGTPYGKDPETKTEGQ